MDELRQSSGNLLEGKARYSGKGYLVGYVHQNTASVLVIDEHANVLVEAGALDQVIEEAVIRFDSPCDLTALIPDDLFSRMKEGWNLPRMFKRIDLEYTGNHLRVKFVKGDAPQYFRMEDLGKYEEVRSAEKGNVRPKICKTQVRRQEKDGFDDSVGLSGEFFRYRSIFLEGILDKDPDRIMTGYLELEALAGEYQKAAEYLDDQVPDILLEFHERIRDKKSLQRIVSGYKTTLKEYDEKGLISFIDFSEPIAASVYQLGIADTLAGMGGLLDGTEIIGVMMQSRIIPNEELYKVCEECQSKGIISKRDVESLAALAKKRGYGDNLMRKGCSSALSWND